MRIDDISDNKIAVIYLVIGALALPFIIAFLVTNKNNKELRLSQFTALQESCQQKKAETTSAQPEPEAEYGLYYDNGPQGLPVCRQPKNQEEIQKVVDRREHQMKLENGDINPPSLDENCTGRICQ